MVKPVEKRRRPTISASDIRRVSAAADADARTVQNEVADPDKLHTSARLRVRRALQELKLGAFRERAE